jgi:hypothetical protein
MIQGSETQRGSPQKQMKKMSKSGSGVSVSTQVRLYPQSQWNNPESDPFLKRFVQFSLSMF